MRRALAKERKTTMAVYLENLNEEQLEAVKSTEGYVRVIAGAGSGKTKALTSRYAYIIDELGISTKNILCVTFTNKAANEMRKRIRMMLGDEDLALICTFHSFCNYMLRREITRINYPRNFMILDNEDSKAILRNVYEENGLKSSQITFKQALRSISLRKDADEYLDTILTTSDEELLAKYKAAASERDIVFYGYVYNCRKNYALDFDDLIIFALHLLKNYEDIRLRWQKRLQYVMVDEFQDVSLRQYKLCTILSGYHKNLFVVGDPDQTIYSFRGASVDFLLKFDASFAPTKTVVMDKNYRSSPEIIAASNSLIEKNVERYEKSLKSMREHGNMVVYNHAKSDVEEAEWIARTIDELVASGLKPSDIAILYRAHYVTRVLEEALIRAKRPYVIFSGIEFYGRKEVKDVLSYLRMLVYGDDISFQRTINEPRRNFGKKRMAILKEYQEKTGKTLYESLRDNMFNEFIRKSGAGSYVEVIEKFRAKVEELSPSEIAKQMLIETGYEEMMRLQGDDERLENLSELMISMADFEKSAGEAVSLEDYLSNAALYTNQDKVDEGDKVALMTMHAAKGLEFPAVFACCMSEGIIPSQNTRTKKELEEERRLAYVALTRAEDVLFISDSEGANIGGGFRYPSRFIFNIKKEALEYKVELEKELIEQAMAYIQQFRLQNDRKDAVIADFQIGERVEHPAFGAGVIVATGKHGDVEVKFESTATTRAVSATKLTKAARMEGAVQQASASSSEAEWADDRLDDGYLAALDEYINHFGAAVYDSSIDTGYFEEYIPFEPSCGEVGAEEELWRELETSACLGGEDTDRLGAIQSNGGDWSMATLGAGHYEFGVNLPEGVFELKVISGKGTVWLNTKDGSRDWIDLGSEEGCIAGYTGISSSTYKGFEFSSNLVVEIYRCGMIEV